MNLGTLAATAETHLNDLQADMEAGARQLDRIQSAGTKIQDLLVQTARDQHATHMRAMMILVIELRVCVTQQRKTMRELRHDIRRIRGFDRRA